MKKSLIAIAALAAVSAASAQSSVTLYGKADLWVGNVQAAGVGTTSSTEMGSGGLAGSRWGVKGTEDLGGGLKANFLFEQGIDLETGAASGFNRQAYVGLGSNFGEIRLGNVYTALDDINGAANSGFDSALSATSGVWVGYVSNPNSNIKYVSPDFGGFSGAASYTRNGSGNNLVSLQGAYNNGPIYAGIAYQTDKATVIGTNTKHVLVNGTYDLGMAKLLGSYRQVTNPDSGAGKAKEFQFGVDVPVSSALTMSAGYAQSQDSTGGVDGVKRTGYSLAAGYSMSKRTMLYGGLQFNKVNTAGAEKGHLYAVGVNHSF